MNVKYDPWIIGVFTDCLHQQFMFNIIEQALDIELQYPVVPPASLPGYSKRIGSRLSRPISVGVRMEVWFNLRLEIDFSDHLRHSVRYSGNSKYAYSPVFLGYFYRLTGGGK